MSDDTKILDQNPVSGSQVQPQAPVGIANKEMGPIEVVPEIRHEGPEAKHDIDQELSDLGVKENQGKPNLTHEHSAVGIEHAGPSVPVPSGPTGKITLPMSEEEITGTLKTGQDDDSDKWFAWLLKKIIKWGFKSQ